jgi:hypothetical protein
MADPPGHLRGQYAATIVGSCILAPFGFNPDSTPINGVGLVSTFNREGIFTFEKDGTGSAEVIGSTINLSYPGPGGVTVPPNAASNTISWDFTYTVTDDGMITITQVPGTYFSTNTSGTLAGKTYRVEGVVSKGTITPDGKIITVYLGAPNVLMVYGPNLPPSGVPQICNSSNVMIWQHNEKP